MIDKPSFAPPIAVKRPNIDIAASIHAPFLYFEEAPTFGHVGGIIQITLAATRLYPDNQRVTAERVAVAHLRMNVSAARHLLNAIEGALLLTQPSQTDAQN